MGGHKDDADFPKGDPPLTPLGRHQSELLGIRLKNMGFKGLIYSSPYCRTAETSQIIAEKTETEILISAKVREMVKSEEDIQDFSGMTATQLKSRFSRVRPDIELEYPWWTGKVECNEDILTRVSPFIDDLIAANTDALVVGHARIVGAACFHVLNKFGTGMDSFPRNMNCNLTAIRIRPDFKVICLTDVSHIPADMVSANTKLLSEG